MSHSLLRLSLLLVVLSGFSRAADPTVSNVRAAQKTGTKQVEVYYDISGSTSPVYVSLLISSDGGTTFAVPASTLSGDFGSNIELGRNRKIIWDAGADWNNQVSNTVKFRVTASDTSPVPDEFMLIPAGTFLMGDQSANQVVGADALPVHSVYVSEFHIGKYEVTKELWDNVRAWALDNGYTDLSVGNGNFPSKGVNHPVHSISWYDTIKWCNARSQKEGLTPCYKLGELIFKVGENSSVQCNFASNGYRLPTEAEWEKAARGGLTGKNFPWGDTITHINANYRAKRDSFIHDTSEYADFTYHPDYAINDVPYTSPVGSFAANGYGLHDMSGNLWEWCWDRYGDYPAELQSDPHGPQTGLSRVRRGGSFFNSAFACHVALRVEHPPTGAGHRYGFRIVRKSISD